MKKSNKEEKGFYDKFNNWIGLSFECMDAEKLLCDLWNWHLKSQQKLLEKIEKSILKQKRFFSHDNFIGEVHFALDNVKHDIDALKQQLEKGEE